VEKGVPIDWGGVYAAIFELDPLSLIHGVFFSDPEWAPYGNPRVRRAISAVIEAYGAQPVVSGGVKRDDVRPQIGEGHGTKEGYGFVPFGRTEYAAEEIVLAAVVDLEQLRGYGLAEDRTRLLELVALWELSGLLDAPLRPRTACDLRVADVSVRGPDNFSLPSPQELADDIAATDAGFEHPGPRTVIWKG
jgi:CRISPR-associated protein Csb1